MHAVDGGAHPVVDERSGLDDSRLDGRLDNGLDNRLDNRRLRRRLNGRRGNLALGRFRRFLLELLDALRLGLFRILSRLGVGLVEFLGGFGDSLLLILDALRFRRFGGLLRSSLANDGHFHLNGRRRVDRVGRVERRAELRIKRCVRTRLRLGSPALRRERHRLRHDNLLAGRVFLVDGVGKDVRAIVNHRRRVHDVLAALARGELFPAVGERVLQRHLDPAARLAELRRLNALRGAARLFRDDFRARFHAFFGLERRRLDDFEQVRAVELRERSEHGFEVDGDFERLDGFNGFGGGRHAWNAWIAWWYFDSTSFPYRSLGQKSVSIFI